MTNKKRKLHLWNIAPTNAFSVSCKGVCVRSSITTSSFSLTRARLPVPLPAFSRTVPSCAHDLKINHKKLKQYNQHAVLTHNSAFIIRVLTHSPLDLFFRFIGIRRYKKTTKKENKHVQSTFKYIYCSLNESTYKWGVPAALVPCLLVSMF